MTEDNKDNSNNNSLLQIKPDDLKRRIDKGEDIFILDVRTPEEHKSWKISYDRYQDSSVIPALLHNLFKQSFSLLYN